MKKVGRTMPEKNQGNENRFKRLITISPRTTGFIDPGTKCLGFCVLRSRNENNTLKNSILNFGRVMTTGKDLHCKVSHITTNIIAVMESAGCKMVYIEHPPYTVYEQESSNKDLVVARAISICKLMALVYHLTGTMESKGIEVRHILPVQWQVHHSKRGGLDTKTWAVNYSNIIVSKQPKIYAEKGKLLSDHNVAEAVSMADIMTRKLYNGVYHEQ